MAIQWVLPSIDPEFRDECLAGMDPDIRRRLTLVDNSDVNNGIPRAWNRGIDDAVAAGADWLVVLSESIRFGKSGGRDVEEALALSPPDRLQGLKCDVTCTEVDQTGQGFCRRGYGWHLIGLGRRLWESVGYFDPIYWPGGHEDADFFRRIGLAGLVTYPTPIENIDAHLAACEHTVAAGFLAGVERADTAALFRAKWGAQGDEAIFSRPYDDPRLDLAFTGPFDPSGVVSDPPRPGWLTGSDVGSSPGTSPGPSPAL